jgi:hypothetical protein
MRASARRRSSTARTSPWMPQINRLRLDVRTMYGSIVNQARQTPNPGSLMLMYKGNVSDVYEYVIWLVLTFHK